MSFALIVPSIRPLEPFLADPEVSEIMVNGANHVFVTGAGTNGLRPRFRESKLDGANSQRLGQPLLRVGGGIGVWLGFQSQIVV